MTFVVFTAIAAAAGWMAFYGLPALWDRVVARIMPARVPAPDPLRDGGPLTRAEEDAFREIKAACHLTAPVPPVGESPGGGTGEPSGEAA